MTTTLYEAVTGRHRERASAATITHIVGAAQTIIAGERIALAEAIGAYIVAGTWVPIIASKIGERRRLAALRGGADAP